MFGINNALCFAATQPGVGAVRMASATAKPIGGGAPWGTCHPLTDKLKPIPQPSAHQHVRHSAFASSMAASLRESEASTPPKFNKMAFEPCPDGFILEPNFVFSADKLTQGQSNMPADEQTQEPVPPQQSQGTRSIFIEPDTADNNTRVLIQIGKGLQESTLAEIGSALTHHLCDHNEGFSNLQVDVTQRVSSSIVAAEITASSTDWQARAASERPDMSPDKSANTQTGAENPLRATLTAAVNCLQRCRGVLSIEADRQVKQQ